MVLDEHEQLTAQEIGKEGCYMFCIKRIAELETGIEMNPIQVYREGVAQGLLRSDCLVLDAGKLLSGLTGKSWNKVNVPTSAQFGNAKYIIAQWVKKTGSATLTHFVLMENDGKTIKYNPLLNDWLAVGWSIQDYRVFYES